MAAVLSAHLTPHSVLDYVAPTPILGVFTLAKSSLSGDDTLEKGTKSVNLTATFATRTSTPPAKRVLRHFTASLHPTHVLSTSPFHGASTTAFTLGYSQLSDGSSLAGGGIHSLWTFTGAGHIYTHGSGVFAYKKAISATLHPSTTLQSVHHSITTTWTFSGHGHLNSTGFVTTFYDTYLYGTERVRTPTGSALITGGHFSIRIVGSGHLGTQGSVTTFYDTYLYGSPFDPAPIGFSYNLHGPTIAGFTLPGAYGANAFGVNPYAGGASTTGSGGGGSVSFPRSAGHLGTHGFVTTFYDTYLYGTETPLSPLGSSLQHGKTTWAFSGLGRLRLAGFGYILPISQPPPPPPPVQPVTQAPLANYPVTFAPVPLLQYILTDNGTATGHFNTIARLPFTQGSFSLVLNDSGQLQASLPVNDFALNNIDWRVATSTNLSCIWIDIDGALIFGGLIQNRNYVRETGILEVTANELYSYLTQRLQAKDYSTNWSTAARATGAINIAYTVIADALAKQPSIPIQVTTEGSSVPLGAEIAFTAPLSQLQSVDSIVSQLQQMGLNIGFDFAIDYSYDQFMRPVATLTLSYPLRGQSAAVSGLVIDTTYATNFSWAEDGTQQANIVYELSTNTGGIGASARWTDSYDVDGYPLLEMVGAQADLSPVGNFTNSQNTSEPNRILNAWAQDDLALYAYPIVTPVITLDSFQPSMKLGQWGVGDEVRLIIPKQSIHGGGAIGTYSTLTTYDSTLGYDTTAPYDTGMGATVLPADPRFPDGLDTTFRVTRADVTIADEGASTTQYTLNMPLKSQPQPPPGIEPAD